jgi:hypothetical protein
MQPSPLITHPEEKVQVPPLDVSLFFRTVFTMPLAGKLEHAEIPIFFDKATKKTTYIHNTRALAVLCDESIKVTQNTFAVFLGKHLHFKREMVSVGKAYYSPAHVILAIAEILNCGSTNPDAYNIDAGVAANTILLRREDFARNLPIAIERVRPGKRFVEVSACPGDASTGINGQASHHVHVDSESDDDDDERADSSSTTSTDIISFTNPVYFWSDLVNVPEAEHQGAIERFFVHPHVAAVYARMHALEYEQQDAELSIMCDACEHGFQPTGYVYAAWNVFFGHLLKIGATMRTPSIRLRELSGAGVPEPFELVAYIKTPNPFALEKTIHRHYDSVRKYGRSKEFFTLTREAAIAFFKSLGGHDPVQNPPPPPPSKQQKKRKAAYASYTDDTTSGEDF